MHPGNEPRTWFAWLSVWGHLIEIIICSVSPGRTTKKYSTIEKRSFRTDVYKFKMDTLCQRYHGGRHINSKKTKMKSWSFQLYFVFRMLSMKN